MVDVRTHYDVIVIGSGAGGATLANELANAGKTVLILERGAHLPRASVNWDSRYVFIDRQYRTDERWLDKHHKSFTPNTHYWVGGNTTFYGAALFRLRPEDFEERIHHGGGVSPAWPIRYDDLKPWYLKAEHMWKVHGRRGVDPTERADEPDYAYPPLRHDPTVANLEKHLQSLGWTPSPIPLGVMRDDDHPHLSDCIRCLTCGGYPCLVRAKADAKTIALDPILRLPNVTLLPSRKVVKLETDPTGTTVRRVVAEGPEGVEEFMGDIVVLAAGAANTAAILLASDSSHHPRGLANGSDQVGRNYMFHTLSAVISITPTKVRADFPKTMCVNDFYWGDAAEGFNYPMGHIQLLEHMEGHVLEGQVKEEGVDDHFFPDILANAAADRMLAFLCISEDLPHPENRVTLSLNRIKLAYTHRDLEGHHRLVKKLDQGLAHFNDGGHPFSRHHFQVHKMLPLYGTAHMCGTTRMGNDPATSVVDPNCKAWELDNLYITDASVFVSSGAVNPTLTIVANAMRVADHLKARMDGAPSAPPPADPTPPPPPPAPPAMPAGEMELNIEAMRRRPRRPFWPFGGRK
jgi:choline dehydrogenase-like flavoprotein